MRVLRLLIVAGSVLALAGAALVLPSAHARASFRHAAGTPVAPAAHRAPWPAWAHRAAGSADAAPNTPPDRQLSAPSEEARGGAPAYPSDASAPEAPAAPPFARSRQTAGPSRLTGVALRIPAPPPRRA